MQARTSASPAAAEQGAPFHLVSLLEARLPALRRRPKRLRTRAQILAVTAREMERVGYEGLTIDAVTEALGIARGTFYLHFRDRSQAALTVMRMYLALVQRRRPRGGRRLPLRESIERMNAYYVRVYALNAKLLLGRESLLRDRRELMQLRDQLNARWAAAIVRDIVARRGDTADTGDKLLFLQARCVIAMVDDLLREIYLYRAASLAHFVDDEAAVVTALSDIWHRAIFAEAAAPPQAANGRRSTARAAASRDRR